MWTVSVPLFVQVSKNKRFYLNLNGYRNEHYQVLNKAKVMFTALVKPLISHIPHNLGTVRIHYRLFPRTRAELDTANILCIVDKFFCDALVEHKVLIDDNHKIVLKVSFDYGEVDSINPRAEVTITQGETEETTSTIQPEESDHMKITITQNEIEAAIVAFIASSMTINEGHDITVDLRATRGDGGYTAEIDISPRGANQGAEPAAEAPARATRQPRAAAAPAAAEASNTVAADNAAGAVTSAAEPEQAAAVAQAEAPAEAVTAAPATERPSLFAQ